MASFSHEIAPDAAARNTLIARVRPKLSEAILSSCCCCVALCIVLRVWRLDLHVPFTYWGDALYIETWVKGVMEGNWPWSNPRLGMPFGADWRDFPVNMTLEAIAARLLSLFTSSFGLVTNLLWIGGSTAAAGLATFGFRRLGIIPGVACVLGVLYGLQPFGFYRGVSHLNLMFFLVPLLATGAIEITRGRFAQIVDESGAKVRFRLSLYGLPLYLWLGCIAQGVSYIYNAFFTGVLLTVATLLCWLGRRSSKVALTGLIAICVLILAIGASLTPTLAYWTSHGKNHGMSYKSPREAEVYGLKIRHLVTPVPGNPFPPLRWVQERLDGAGFLGDNENTSARLGTVGTIGFLVLVVVMLFGVRSEERAERYGVLTSCAALTLTCLLLATVGGLGTIFNTFVLPDIRCYNRISVFIEFFALCAVGCLLTSLVEERNIPRPAYWAALTCLLVCGVADQAYVATPSQDVARQTAYRKDANFIRAVESGLPEGSSVFQIPYTAFPLDGGTHQMGIYDHSKVYLHSKSLKISWGAIGGRESADWNQQTATSVADEMLVRLASKGFAALWINRAGFPPGASPEASIRDALGQAPTVSEDGQIATYDVRDYLLTRRHLHPDVKLTFGEGFYDLERDNRQTWRWGKRHAVLSVANHLDKQRVLKLSTVLQTGFSSGQRLSITSRGEKDLLSVTDIGVPYSLALHLAPREKIDIQFDCQCKQIKPAGEMRAIYFGLINTRITE